jgi:hypothetical protein
MRPLNAGFALLIATSLPAPCLAQSTSPSETSSGSSVKILRITPDVSKPLFIGERVALAIDVEYTMAKDSGTLSLVVQRGESGFQPLAYTTEVVSRGKETVTLKVDFEVPDTRAITIFTPLSNQGDSYTHIVDTRAYKVRNR